MTSYTLLKTAPLGELLLVANPAHLVGIYFADCPHAPAVQSSWANNPRHPVLAQAAVELHEYLAGTRKNFSIPLAAAGTPFQQNIWRQIARIPYGKTITYSQLAKSTGTPDAIRAAGTATGKNPLSILIPCHRVVGKNGTLTGYAGGLDRKRRLLALEQDVSMRSMRSDTVPAFMLK